MVGCHHENCGKEKRIWLPKIIKQSNDARDIGSSGRSDIALHHWCVLCGCIKNISDDKSKKLGYWINILSRIQKDNFLTNVQKRLIVKELESIDNFEDSYGTTCSAQKELFTKIVIKYIKVHHSIIDSYI